MPEETVELWEVEVILRAHLKEKKTNQPEVWEYYVSWAGYGDDYNEWRSQGKLESSCNDLLVSFWENVGGRDNSWKKGKMVFPSKEWVASQKESHASAWAGAEGYGEVTIWNKKDFKPSVLPSKDDH
ncbi:hypothetical protein EIP91_011329 [Steccherinum ochraceum]|uniref:Chromo domain-containing protein n=1 Tax=Steccherinum ochraceum TaxID=92696 RepID=A0A4R0R1X7_9APHY|nr:hypothetical protein EIP91_011329 [Steccherinum ochraceum]